MNIVIVGQGAIGLLWYHHLSQDSQMKISLLCSNNLKNKPLHYSFTDINNQLNTYPLLSAQANSLANADIVIICVKSYQAQKALDTLSNRISSKTLIVFCHNGLGAITNLSSIKQPCFALLTTHASKVLAPFHIQHTGIGHSDIGLISGKASYKGKECLASILHNALPSLTYVDNIIEKQWLKLAINSVINPITALHNINNGEVLSSRFNDKIEQLIQEIVTVAAKDNIVFDFFALKSQIQKVAKNTAKNCSSMRSDVLNKRLTEIDYINGYLVKRAQHHNIEVPINTQMIERINSLNK